MWNRPYDFACAKSVSDEKSVEFLQQNNLFPKNPNCEVCGDDMKISLGGYTLWMDFELADKITKECLDHYNSLPKKGKPIPGQEWTLLSAIVMSLDSKITVVSMATGTKCLGRSGMSPTGDLVNDSHAEVLARRCFLRYVYDQITQFKKTGSSNIINKANENNKFEINSKVRFHFYTSHVPCGDASIIPKFEGENRKRKRNNSINEIQNWTNIKSVQNDGDSQHTCSNECSDDCFEYETAASHTTVVHELFKEHSQEDQRSKKCKTACSSQSLNVDDCESESQQVKKTAVEKNERLCGPDEDLSDCLGEVVDIHRTGAKCVSGQDSKLPGAKYHTPSAVRTKPGRGDPTLSVSCSDKLARWIACGLQGAMLSTLLIGPVLLHSVVVGGGGPYSEPVMHRALVQRTNTPHRPLLLHSDIVFPASRYAARPAAKPCPSAILWSRVSSRALEVCVEGKRQGATKKCRDGGRLAVCKQELMRTFLSLSGDKYIGSSYRSIKASAVQYNNAWTKVKEALGVWTSKPSHLQDFIAS